MLDAFIKKHKEDMRKGALYPIDERDVAMLAADFIAGGNRNFIGRSVEICFM